MVLVFSDKAKVDSEKCLKMAVVHDLSEVLEGDVYRLDLSKQERKYEREKASVDKLAALLPKDTGKEIIDLCLEFEGEKTRESRFVKLLDRLEVLIQHNEAGAKTWDETEKRIHYGLAAKHAERYGFLHDFALELDKEMKSKLIESGFTPKRINMEEYEKYYGMRKNIRFLK
jgi:putative hydrolase of HD superfamily